MLRLQHKGKRKPGIDKKYKPIKVIRLVKKYLISVPKNLRFIVIFAMVLGVLYMLYVILSFDFSDTSESNFEFQDPNSVILSDDSPFFNLLKENQNS